MAYMGTVITVAESLCRTISCSLFKMFPYIAIEPDTNLRSRI
jgi:hypothetical protein